MESTGFPADHVAVVTRNDTTRIDSNRLVLKGRTQWDETKRAPRSNKLNLMQGDPVEAALAKALVESSDAETIKAIVAELAARRTQK